MCKRTGLAILLTVVALCLGSALAATNGVTEYVGTLGLTPDVTANPGGGLRCDYAAVSADMAVLNWSDAERVYTVSGEPAVLAPAYVDLLGMARWDSCACEVGDLVHLAYGVEGEGAVDFLDRYIDRVRQTLLGLSAATEDARHYVLNNNTMKFHDPGCSSAAQIKDKNREEYDGSREALIARGYSPCGNCKP